jgi:hypothetical protein
MNTLEFLSRLRSLNISLALAGDELRISAPKGVLTPDLRAELTQRKPEIVAFLRQAKPATGNVRPPLLRTSREGELPLSFAQERIWFLDQLEPGLQHSCGASPAWRAGYDGA